MIKYKKFSRQRGTPMREAIFEDKQTAFGI